MGDAADAPTLTDVQHRLQYALLDPGAPAEQAEAMLAGTPELSAARRLEIYRNGCRNRQLETMAHLHPALRHLLGDELFDDFASGYLEARPSRAYTMARLDEGFAGYLSAGRPDSDGSQAWVDILIDLARYERAFAEVYDGPGTEQDGPLTDLLTGQVPEWPAGRPALAAALGERRIVMAPCVRSLRVGAAVHEYHAAVRGGTNPPPLTPQPTYLALWRRDYRVRVTALAPQAHALLEALLGGAAFREARATAALEPAVAWGHVREWSACGWISAFTEPPPPPQTPETSETPATPGARREPAASSTPPAPHGSTQ
ncbi:DNA-binding domain-containing protein [Actinomadura oligospora]|uniref:HvfC/BufC N-terminal domain-containing protein n=1 Tax=Actinomadura oligospora TaxID=111804 RepID=UPI00047E3F80|nr:DNA-binding domain-containing protein [Actinomadura oligospora]